jgi:hypothetical protein
MDTPEQQLRAMYVAFNDRDIDGVLATMTPDVDWPNGWEGGRVSGQAAVRDYWTRQWAEVDPRVEPVSIAPGEDERVDVEVRQIVRDRDGNLLSDDIVHHVYTFADGLVTRMDIE